MKAQYTKKRTANSWQFNVTPASPFKGWGLKIFLYGSSFILSAIIGACVDSANTPRGASHSINNNGWWTFIIMIVAIFGLLRWHFKRTEKKLRFPAQFEANEQGIVISGKQIDSDGMHRLVLKNWMANIDDGGSVTATTVAYTNNFGGVVGAAAIQFQNGMHQISEQAKREYQRKFAENCWQLDVEAAGRATMLACGLDQVTAFGLMEDTHRAIWGK